MDSLAFRAINKARAISKPYWHSFGNLHCPVCDHSVREFLPISSHLVQSLEIFGFDLPLERFETFNLDSYECPLCGATDRDRLYAAYVEQVNLPEFGRMVEFAPSGPLTSKLRKLFPECEIRTADLMMPHVDDHVDICSMPIYADESIDFFVCSHVLEHVKDDVSAVRELFRILRDGARGIIMVPIHLDLTTTRDGGWNMNTAERWKNFGQDDHVRLYSKEGFAALLHSVGFLLSSPIIVTTNQGISPNSVLYVASKSQSGA